MIGSQCLSSMKVDVSLCGSIPRSCFIRSKNEQTVAISNADRLDPELTVEASRTASELRSSPQLQNKKSTVLSTLATGLVKCSPFPLSTNHPTFVKCSTSISVEPFPSSERPLYHALLTKKEYSHIPKPSTQNLAKSVSDESLSDMSSSCICEIPPWAVPANGYSRLEVRFPIVKHITSQDELILICSQSQSTRETSTRVQLILQSRLLYTLEDLLRMTSFSFTKLLAGDMPQSFTILVELVLFKIVILHTELT